MLGLCCGIVLAQVVGDFDSSLVYVNNLIVIIFNNMLDND